MNTSELRYPFAAPVVPIADRVDGLLQTVDLGGPILVDVVVWDAVQPGDYMQLMLNERHVGAIYTFTDKDKPGDLVTLQLDEQLLDRDGKYALTFQSTNPISIVTITSPRAYIRVDRQNPGGALLASMIFPAVTLGDNLTGQIAGYTGVQKGDFIQTACNGVKGPTHTVTDEELLHTPIKIVFEREFLHSLGSSSVLIEYFITDRAGNVSIMSLPVSLTIQV